MQTPEADAREALADIELIKKRIQSGQILLSSVNAILLGNFGSDALSRILRYAEHSARKDAELDEAVEKYNRHKLEDKIY